VAALVASEVFYVGSLQCLDHSWLPGPTQTCGSQIRDDSFVCFIAVPWTCWNISSICHLSVTSTQQHSDSCSANQQWFCQHLAERSASATSNQCCAVCSERYNRAKRQDPSASNSALPKRTKTVYRCTACSVYLCVGTGKDNCFAVYHSLVDYWR